MASLSEPTNTVWSFPCMSQDWEQTPLAVQAYVRILRDEVAQLHDRVETLEARLAQHSTTSSRPPSSEAPFQKPRRHTTSTTPRKAGGEPGYPGHRQVLLPPTTVKELRPERCPCGSTTFTLTTPYHTHQVIELPPIAMEVTHWMLHQGWCLACGRWRKAQVPAEQATGYGPRCSALMGALAGSYGNGRRMVQTLCASVLQVPISLGAIQNVLDRVAQAIDPYYNNRAERALRCGVLWRKRSLGTASEKGNRWVERILSLRETCRLHARATYTVLVEAMTSLFHGQPPDLSWINAGVSTSAHPQ